jgi:hypothetical protein
MNIEGNGVVIASGDTTPANTDDTDFGTVNVGSIQSRTYTIRNSGRETLVLMGDPLVSIGGTNAGDFTVTTQPYSTLVSGNTTSFGITFTPGTSGTRIATISIASNDPLTNPYTFAIRRTGSIPVVGGGSISPTTVPPTTIPPTTMPPTTVPPTIPTDNPVQLTVDVKGETGTATIKKDGTVEGNIMVSSPDKEITLSIPDGTKVMTGGSVPTQISITPDEDPPAPPTDKNIIGIAYECLPEGTTFNPPVTITWKYDPDKLPEGVDASQLKVAYYNKTTGKWEAVEGVVDTVNHTITAKISHFSTYAIVVPLVAEEAEIPASSNNRWMTARIIIGAVVIFLIIILAARRRKKEKTV